MSLPTAPVAIHTLTDLIGVQAELDFLLIETPAPLPGSWEAKRIQDLDQSLRMYRAQQLVPLPLGSEW